MVVFLLQQKKTNIVLFVKHLYQGIFLLFTTIITRAPHKKAL